MYRLCKRLPEGKPLIWDTYGYLSVSTRRRGSERNRWQVSNHLAALCMGAAGWRWSDRLRIQPRAIETDLWHMETIVTYYGPWQVIYEEIYIYVYIYIYNIYIYDPYDPICIGMPIINNQYDMISNQNIAIALSCWARRDRHRMPSQPSSCLSSCGQLCARRAMATVPVNPKPFLNDLTGAAAGICLGIWWISPGIVRKKHVPSGKLT